MRRARILIIDDEPDICILLAEALSSPDWIIEWTTHPLDTVERVAREIYDLILLDIKMPDISGLDLLPRLKKASPETAVMIMSAFGTVSMAVQAMKKGAEDYLEKPFRDIEEIKLAVSRLIETARIRMENRILRQQLEEKFQLDGLVSASPKMQDVFALVRKVAPLYTTVLITGETGTGKELISRTLHRLSKRSSGPFISVNSGGLPEGLLESLLFGHEKGAFTGAVRRTKGYFEEADGGTLFLDEIGDMPPTLQVKLLRVLQERSIRRVGGDEEITVDVRLIAATNKNLEEETAKGNFRKDLFFRLNVIIIPLPPLRERREDIPLLVQHFLNKYSRAFHRQMCELSPDAISHLYNHSWPGNVRELEHLIERVVALSEKHIITADDLKDSIPSHSGDWFSDILNLPIREARREFERRYLIENLHRHQDCVTSAARSAGLPRQNYHRKMKQLGIPPTKRRTDDVLSEV